MNAQITFSQGIAADRVGCGLRRTRLAARASGRHPVALERTRSSSVKWSSMETRVGSATSVHPLALSTGLWASSSSTSPSASLLRIRRGFWRMDPPLLTIVITRSVACRSMPATGSASCVSSHPRAT